MALRQAEYFLFVCKNDKVFGCQACYRYIVSLTMLDHQLAGDVYGIEKAGLEVSGFQLF